MMLWTVLILGVWLREQGQVNAQFSPQPQPLYGGYVQFVPLRGLPVYNYQYGMVPQGHSAQRVPDADTDRLATNFGFRPGYYPPAGALASPQPTRGLSDSPPSPANFGFNPGTTPPPGTFASPQGFPPQQPPNTPKDQLATNFGFRPGYLPPPGTVASPQPAGPPPSPANFGFNPGTTPPPGTFASPQPPKPYNK